MAYRRFKYLKAEGFVENRATLARRIRAGIFPPGENLSNNVVVWTDEVLNEVRERARRCDVSPHVEWLARAKARRQAQENDPARKRQRQAAVAKARKAKKRKPAAASASPSVSAE